MDFITEFIKAKRQEHAFLRQNGATVAAERGDSILRELEQLVHQTDPEYSVGEAARLTGVHPESIRRKVRKGELGRQAGKACAMVVRASELPKLVPRRKKAPSGELRYHAEGHADRLLSKLGRG